ncbi:unnamed protein product [Ilex paraguariensis]|uniref:X8 domain-containing protein n=1 Tax=Ilex paraguariensis TaxID=185542 RepID=A0ABC8R607_9AQUA
MGARVLHCCIFFLYCFSFISGSSLPEKPTPEAILQNERLDNQVDRMMFSPSSFTTQLDGDPGTIPIVNPTTPATTPPTTTTPIVNPPIPPSPTTMVPPTPTTTTPVSSGGTWCIASSTASQTALQVALDYACGYGGADCSAIQPGSSCYEPNTLRDHASFAFNNYYQKNPAPTSCVFGGTAMLTNTDPSSGNCRFPSSRTTSTTPMPPTTPTIPITPPSITSPVNPYTTPSGPTVYTEPAGYAAEPTGIPNSADSMSHNLLLLYSTACLLMSVLVSNYL